MVDFDSLVSGFLTVSQDKNIALYNAINTWIVLHRGRPAFKPDPNINVIAMNHYLLSFRFAVLIGSKARVVAVRHENDTCLIVLGSKPADNVIDALMRLDAGKSRKWNYDDDDRAFGQLLGYGSHDSLKTLIDNNPVLLVNIYAKSAKGNKQLNFFGYYDRLDDPDAIRRGRMIFNRIRRCLPSEWNEAVLDSQKTDA